MLYWIGAVVIAFGLGVGFAEQVKSFLRALGVELENKAAADAATVAAKIKEKT